MTTKQKKDNPQVGARLKEFWNAHESYDSPWARNILHNLNEFFPFVFDWKNLERGVPLLYGAELERWFEGPETLSAQELRELPIFQLVLELRAYAYYGLDLGLLEALQDRDAFLELIDLELIPLQWARDSEMTDTIHAAQARRKIDFSVKEGLTPQELASLAQVSRKSIMNMLAPGSRRVLQANTDNLITVESAQRWLLARPDFRPSIWQQQKNQSVKLPNSEASSIEEPLFVPIGDQGAWFSPAHRHQQDERYYVGNGNDEQKFDDYWNALDFLTRAASPRWRYADTTGRWRIKTAIGWERKSRKELEDLLSSDQKSKDARTA
jgi:hypothetical protein